jgi:hypothetical protein
MTCPVMGTRTALSPKGAVTIRCARRSTSTHCGASPTRSSKNAISRISGSAEWVGRVP